MVASARPPGTPSLNLMLMNARWFARDVGIPKCLRSPTSSPPDWLPVNHKDRSNKTTASRPARIADGDRSALLSRIAPQSGCRRCQGTHDRAVWGKSSGHSQAREQAAALRWRQLQGRLSSEFPLRFTSQNIHAVIRCAPSCRRSPW
jgi:hypothetical protein